MAVVLLLLVALYAAGRAIGREALIGWLRAHGVASQVVVQDLGFGHVAGRLRLGDPKAPDFNAGEATVTFGRRGLGVELRSVTLRGPTLRARLHGGRLSLGSLDPLVAELLKTPSPPGAVRPRIEIDHGLLLLATDAGAVRMTVDAVVDNGRLVSARATTAPMRLQTAAFDASLGAGSLRLQTRNGRIGLAVSAPVTRFSARGLAGTGLSMQIAAQAPYPDLQHKQETGAVTARATVGGGRLVVSGQPLAGATLALGFDGHAAGGIGDLVLIGRGTADLRAAAAGQGALCSGPMRVLASAEDLRWSRRGGDAVSASPTLTVTARDLAAGALWLPALSATLHGPLSFGPGGLQAAVAGSIAGLGAWSGLGPPAAADSAQMAALKRAARSFRISAPSVRFAWRAGAPRVALPQPLRLTTGGGGILAIGRRGTAPIYDAGGAALTLSLHGGGLPTAAADIRRLRFASGGVTADGRVSAGFSIGPVEGASLDGSGTLRIAGGDVRFTASGCIPVQAHKLDLGADAIERVAARLCPLGEPMFTLANGHWRLRARAEGLAADAPFLQAGIDGGDVRLTAARTAGSLTARAVFEKARLRDEAQTRRFQPLRLAGTASLAGDRWSADLRASTPAGVAVGQAAAHGDTRGRGGAAIDTGPLVFADGALQPADLSPLAAPIGSPVQGQVRFTGHFDWTPAGAASGGLLAVNGLDFQSPAGRVTGLRGEVAFSSLAPLVAPPGQTLTADRLATVVPLTGLSASFGLDGKALSVTGGEAAVGGGRLRVESLTVPLAPDAPVQGVVDVEGVQLHDLVEASPFGDRVDLDAKVSGRLPFESQAGKVRIADAELHAVQPGRLSISRKALTGAAPGGTVDTPAAPATAVPANDAFTDFAYQAMENLAFDKLEAAIATHADGRLGVLAHIVGRHDPPQHQEIRISIFDLIGRKFLNRKLPLPSGTGVNLTLDLTLNLDDLLKDYADYQRLRNSPPVQP
ncbi:MAG: YdbH domain-containing protein [Caulobacterales bacterium]